MHKHPNRKAALFVCALVLLLFCLVLYHLRKEDNIIRSTLKTDNVVGSLKSDRLFSLSTRLILKNCKSQMSDLKLLEDAQRFPVFNGSMLQSHPPFVTSASSNHYDELVGYIENLQTVIKNYSLIIYDIGLTTTQRNFLSRVEGVSLRTFDFNKYPSYVGNVFEYRWKALVVAEVMKELDAFWYTDTSVTWKSNDLGRYVYSKISCDKRGLCNRSPVTLFDNGGRILHLTHPGMFKYLLETNTTSSLVNVSMYGAGFAFYVKSKLSYQVLRAYVFCSLEKDCMAPPGSKLSGCKLSSSFPANSKYSGCHRYDQSALNLILYQLNAHNTSHYILDDTDFAAVLRGRKAKRPNDIRMHT